MNNKHAYLTLACLCSIIALSLDASEASSRSASSSSSAESESSSSAASSSSAGEMRKRHKVLQTNLSSLGTLNLNSDQLQKVILRSCDGALAPIFLGSAGLVCTTAGAIVMASSPAGSVLLLSMGAGYFAIAGFCGMGGRNTSSTRTSKHSHKSE